MTGTEEKTTKTDAQIDPDAKEGKVSALIKKMRRHPWFRAGLVVLLVLICIAGVLYWDDMQSKIYIENARITAPVISISPASPGVIDQLYVSVGDHVRKDQILAKVGDETLLAKTDGVITGVENTPGHLVNPLTDTQPVISMEDTRELRVTGRVQEDKGLKDISPGQYVVFTADAYSSYQYPGLVERIAPAAREGDIVFSISDKRQEQEFDVTVSYDVRAYPELKNGMSAKMWIYK
jgi:multidrug resistance efflux pump